MKVYAPAEKRDDSVKVPPLDADSAPPQSEATSVVFGDPDSIARRGRIKIRKYRNLPKPKHGKQPASRYHAIWIVLDGEPTKRFCNTCGSGSWLTIGRDALFADVRCAVGHDAQVLNGFYLEKPFEQDREEQPSRSNQPTPLGRKSKSSATLSFNDLHSREKGDTPAMAGKKAPAKKSLKKPGGKKS